ncbi:hypothetical protein GS3922_12200 [Geobacillus subterraneus]|uniref:Uncharacterized protein n=1 Tax=Geobacillus subterraneus TaxID=129338 RepID=A0ABM6ADE2_9BACL|nr:hypothetical protein GS3922_12200 [Geobacillus subterraneus]KZS25168.1 hypothetical protein A5418_06795 [Geobacillus subterraneus]
MPLICSWQPFFTGLLEQEKEKAVKEAEKQKAIEIAKNFLDVLPIHEVAKRTGLTVAEVAELAKAMDQNQPPVQ